MFHRPVVKINGRTPVTSIKKHPPAIPQAALWEPTFVEATRTNLWRDSLSIDRASIATSANTAGSGCADCEYQSAGEFRALDCDAGL